MNTEQDLWIDRVRGAWQTSSAEPPPGDHPSPEELWDAATGRLSPEATAQVVDHVALCSPCAEEWQLARGLEAEPLGGASALADVVRLPGRPPKAVWWDPRWAAAAALVVGAIGLAVFLPKAPPGETPAYRGTDGGRIESLVRDNAPVTRKGFKLAWKPVSGAVSYDLTLRTSALDTVVEVTGLTATEFDVPADKLSHLRPASHLVWQVEAVFPDGSRSARPATFRLTLEE